jgi:hypothetical protein
MKQSIQPGGTLDALTLTEARQLIEAQFRKEVEQPLRAAESLVLSASGGGTVEVYEVPIGFELEVRRIAIDLASATDPGTGQQALGAGHTVEYLRSGTRIEWGQPAFNSVAQVPGVQTWGKQQGPYLRNGEVFEVRFVGIGTGAAVVVQIQAILRHPSKIDRKRNGHQ